MKGSGGMEIKFCPHCYKRVSKSTIDGYSWQCIGCDEDFYDFETLNISWLLEIVEKELRTHKKKWYVDSIIDTNGHFGIALEGLEQMSIHGRLMYPMTYEYRKELALYVKNYIREQSKIWVRKQF